MKQISRQLTDSQDGFLIGKRYVLMDRDDKFCPTFQGLLENEGIAPVPLPAKPPNLTPMWSASLAR